MKLFFIIASFVITDLHIQAQTISKDTLYLLVDQTNPKVSLYRESWYKDTLANRRYLRREYSIDVPLPCPQDSTNTDEPFVFYHNSRPWQGLDPWYFDLAEITKDTSFLSTHHILNYDTLVKWKSQKTYDSFSGGVHTPRDEMPVVFVIDKADIKDGRILLLQARFRRLSGHE